jgi:hypothetical protein
MSHNVTQVIEATSKKKRDNDTEQNLFRHIFRDSDKELP